MTNRKPAGTKYKVKAPNFRIGKGGMPQFIDNDHLACIGNRGVEIWNVSSRKREHLIKRIRNGWNFACSSTREWVVTKNDYGELGFSSLESGELYHKTKRAPYQDGVDIAACVDDVHVVDASSDGDIFVHNIHKKTIDAHESLGPDWMSTGVDVCHSTGESWVAFNPKACISSQEPGACIWRIENVLSLGDAKKFKLERQVQRFSVNPSGTRIAAILDPPSIEQSAEIMLLDVEGNVLARNELPGRDVYFAPPQWSPDGSEILIVLDRRRVAFLDADSLAVRETAIGPNISGACYSPNGSTIALTSEDGGVVLERSELPVWSKLEGRPAADLVEAEFLAYTRRIDLRKGSPPRVAIFRTANSYVVEAERLVGYFRYLPQPEPEELHLTISADELGNAAKRGLQRFVESPDARQPMFGPDFPGEEERLAMSGITPEQLRYVRYLGHPIGYKVDVSMPSSYVSVCLMDQMFDLWRCPHLEGNEFKEVDWPHVCLSSQSSSEELGSALIKALSMES